MKKNKSKVQCGGGFIVVVCLLIGVLFLGISWVGAEEEIKIGGIFPMTGTGAQWGECKSAGASLRIEEENSLGGINGKKLKMVVCDHKGIAREGVACANKLIHVEHIPAFEVTYSGIVMASIPVANQNKTVLLNTAATDPKIREGGPWIFSIRPLGDLEGKAQAEFVYKELGLKRAVIMYINNAFGLGISQVVREEFQKLGGSVLAYEAHAQGATDFRSELTKLKSLKPEIVFLESYYMEIGLIVKQAAELGLSGVRWLSDPSVQQPQFVEIAGKAGEGFMCSIAGFDPEDPRQIVQDFKKNIKAKYNVEAEMYGAMTYDGIKLLAEVMRKSGTSADDIRQGLHKIRDFEGVTGANVNFDKDGMVLKKLMFNILKNGKWVRYQK